MTKTKSIHGRLVLFVSACALSAFMAGATFAQDRQDGLAERDTRLADLMVIIQLRHAKLWYAAKLENWPLAAYQIDLLSVALEEAAELAPGLPFEVDGATAPLAETIAAQDAASFDSAFHTMTDACNGCHATADVGFIEIRVPARASPYSNQVFGAP